jgi:hypothetical protein
MTNLDAQIGIAGFILHKLGAYIEGKGLPIDRRAASDDTAA